MFPVEFLKFIVIFEFSTIKIVKLPNFSKKTKIPNFTTKEALSGYFWSNILKKYCHICIQHIEICLIGKFPPKNKNA